MKLQVEIFVSHVLRTKSYFSVSCGPAAAAAEGI